MAERALPPAAPASPEPASSAVSTAFGSPLEPVAAIAAAAPAHDTYVVQVQKDQIYRVPPPENAYLAERYRNERGGGGGGGGGNKKKRAGGKGPACSPCVVRTLGALLAAALLLAAAVLICLVVLRPGVPSFSVDGLTVHSSASRKQQMDYDVFLTAVNPNKLSALWYRSGTARLLHQGAALASGHVGQPADGGEDATDFTVLLQGVKRDGRTPKAVEKGFSGSKEHIALQLTVEVTVQVHVGALGFGQRRLDVACDVTAAGLSKDVHIASQNCKSRFRN
ncbi:hypothetical protein BS78_01G451700 [Paspalum vaginatum]|nr:hypothetical protein BS78_01G451700 [Paspalum vaginatum]